MGLRCLSLDPGQATPASQIASAIQGRLDDVERVAEVIRRCGRVTLENEFIPAEVVRAAFLETERDEATATPGVDALATIQDKLRQRQAYARAGVPSPTAVEVDGGLPDLPFPLVLKARFGGYDGRGTRYARTPDEFAGYRELWGGGGWLAEEFVPFRRELAVMAYVSSTETGCFPTMETIQTNHVCDLVFPAEVDASEIALAAVRAVGGKGLFGVELFEREDGSLLVNEIAPRPHNTGHYTLDWGGISQFDQHVRLAMGLATAQPEGGPTCMANLLGQPGARDYREGLRAALAVDPEARVHWYGKMESRSGRKMGHLNVCGADLIARARAAREAFYRGWTES